MIETVAEAIQWLRDVAEAEPSHPRAPFFREAADDLKRLSSDASERRHICNRGTEGCDLVHPKDGYCCERRPRG